MRIWHRSLIKKLCRQHLLAMWRESLGAYAIITKYRARGPYARHPATLEFVNCPERLHDTLSSVRREMLRRDYHPKTLPKRVSFGGRRRSWESLATQVAKLQAKGCECKVKD